MSLDSYESIFEQFPSVSADEWKNKTIKDLKGESFDRLIWHTKEDIEVLPFYTKEDNEKYQLQIPVKQTNGWQITERVMVNEIADANKEALHSLQSGATSLVFDLQHKLISEDEIKKLTENILLDIAPVFFENYAEENKTLLVNCVKNSCPVIITVVPQHSITDELVFALQNGIKQNSTILYFHFFISPDYFFEIAKLRSFRWLWKQLCELNNKPCNIIIQCETSIKSYSNTNEYNNILRNSTEAMSAVLGGCDSLLINSHDALNENTGFGKRIARNIHHILQHESYFNEIQDAAKGSYYIEYLTNQLCKKSWEKLSRS